MSTFKSAFLVCVLVPAAAAPSPLALLSDVRADLDAPSAVARQPEAESADRNEQQVRAWVERWNALGSDRPSAIDELLALYLPDALHK